MISVPTSPLPLTLLAASLLTGLPGVRPEIAANAARDRVVLLSAGDPEYSALPVPCSRKTDPTAPTHLLVFRDGLCVRDLGVADEESHGERATAGKAIVEQTGIAERAFVAADGRAAVFAKTRYVSRVDVTPGETSTANDTVTGDTTLTLIDPAHPDGRWRITLENSRWARDVVVLPASMGVVVTTFLPRNGPTDVRILDATGRESLRIPDSAAETLRVDASPEGGHVAAEVTFRDSEQLPERGVIVFDLARGTQWTYAWRYGSDAEPVSWKLQSHGVLAVKLAGATRRFDADGRKL